jgi:hypothetical protein
MRYYNELPDLFKDRVNRVHRNMEKISRSYSSIFAQIIYRFLIFTIGSIFLIVLVMSFIAGNHFAELNIVGDHNVIWFLGITGTMLILLNKISSNREEKMLRSEKYAAFEQLKEDLVSINPKLSKSEDREYSMGFVNNIYQYRIYSVFIELLYLFMSPYYLWMWKREVTMNCQQILLLIEENHQLGFVSKHSIFTNIKEMNANPHMLLSFKEFKKNHEWDLPSGGLFIN